LATGTTGTADTAPTSPAAAGEVGRRPGEGSYVGRFAPTPSGPLHFGSLIAAVGSWLDARAAKGTWRVRIEDLDPPRVRPGAADDILRTLERFGLCWDGPVLWQGTRGDAYRAALDRLEADGMLRLCTCSRAALGALTENSSRTEGGGDELFHPAECLPLAPLAAPAPGYSRRLRVRTGPVQFVDRSLGPQQFDVAASIGDFVLQRRDGLYAYQLAVVVDDAAQGITDVVRGADLLASTARQRLVQRALGLPAPRYLHLPLAVDAHGLKLSKSTDAPGLDACAPGDALLAVLRFLGQSPPDELARLGAAEILQWAAAHWRVAGFAGRTAGEPTAGAGVGMGAGRFF
jgi:glutamyl-Q tRNA(Asp) synthetase